MVEFVEAAQVGSPGVCSRAGRSDSQSWRRPLPVSHKRVSASFRVIGGCSGAMVCAGLVV